MESNLRFYISNKLSLKQCWCYGSWDALQVASQQQAHLKGPQPTAHYQPVNPQTRLPQLGSSGFIRVLGWDMHSNFIINSKQPSLLSWAQGLRERPHHVGSCTQKDEVQHSPGDINIHLSKVETSTRLNHRVALEHIHFHFSDTVLTEQLSGLKFVSQK